MPTYEFVTLDVFTDQRFGGNQLAVFPDADGLSSAQMQALANELSLAETTFVLPPENPANTARVRIFTASEEMPFAGHPNVGTGYALARLGRGRDDVLRFEELAGLVEVKVERDQAGEILGATIAAPKALVTGAAFTSDQMADCLGINAVDVLVANHPPIQASVGVGFVIVEVTAHGLATLAPNLASCQALDATLTGTDIRLSLHCYVREPLNRVRARMFSTAGGIIEDSATGSANATLGALLLSLTTEQTAAFQVTQGVEMGRPSLLHVTAHRAPDGVRATVGGGCVPMFRGEVTL